jgi:PAS domain S-box-containing protein
MEANKKNYRILIVEDNPGDFALAEDFLEEQFKNPKIFHAWSFNEAKKMLIEGHGLDLVLLDLSLPDKQGIDLIIEINVLCGKTPVVVLTGFADISFGIKSLSLGATDYILKDDLTPLILYKSIIYSIERKRNILALKDSEQKYSELFHLSPLPMFVFDPVNLNILNANKAAVQHYGYTKHEFLQMFISDLHAGNGNTLSDKISDFSRNTNYTSLPSISRHKKKSGEIIHIEIQGNQIPYQEKNAMVIMTIDITERLNYIQAIEHQNEKLREISWIQSHMVRAPLARLMGLVSLIRNIQDNCAEKEIMIDYLEDSANELDNVIREITAKTDVSVNINPYRLFNSKHSVDA